MKIRVRWQLRRAEFRYPIGTAPRTAVLVGWFRDSGQVHTFRKGWCEAAAHLNPQAIAATWAQFQGLMAHKLAAPERAIIVLARRGEAFLTWPHREELWRAFHVPLFEQVIGPGGELLAAECEAHNGLHVESETLPLKDYTIETTPCACGRSTPRIMTIRPAEAVRSIAAFAR